MIRFAFIGLVSLATAAGPVLAQPTPDPAAPAAPAPVAPVPAAPIPSGAPANPDLTVATVKLQGGVRMSKLIGSAVYNAQNEKVGSVDDLIMKEGNRIVIAVISVGGFLGIGNKLVAVPYEQVVFDTTKDEAKVAMPGATKDALNAMPTFTYSGY